MGIPFPNFVQLVSQYEYSLSSCISSDGVIVTDMVSCFAKSPDVL